MARFRAGVVRAAPLEIQLTAGSRQLEILGWWAFTEGTSGATSIPVLTRPSKPGVALITGTPTIEAIDSPGEFATATFLSEFNSEPSTPDVKVFSYAAPLLCEERWEVGNGVVVMPGESVLLYAQVEGELERNHQEWTADIEWRER